MFIPEAMVVVGEVGGVCECVVCIGWRGAFRGYILVERLRRSYGLVEKESIWKIKIVDVEIPSCRILQDNYFTWVKSRSIVFIIEILRFNLEC